MDKLNYRCIVCNYIYDTAEGDQTQGVKPGTSFDALPDDWQCPVCGASRSEFDEVSF